MDFNWTSVPSVNKRVFCNKSRIKTTLFVVYLIRKQLTNQEEKAVLLCAPTASMNPQKTETKWGIFCEKRDERKTDLWAAGNRKRKTHLIRQRVSDFNQEMGFFVSHRSSSILVRRPRILSITRIYPTITWTNYCLFNRRMFTSRYEEKQSGEQRERERAER